MDWDEFIEQLLAERQYQPAVQNVVLNILDEPIQETVKERLPKSLLEKRKAVLQQFDPLLASTKRKLRIEENCLSFVHVIGGAESGRTRSQHQIIFPSPNQNCCYCLASP